MGGADTYRLLGDEPCVKEHDALDFAEIAEGIAGLIVGSAESTSLTVGIEGGWGTGKSSLMALIRAELEEHVEMEAPKAGWRARIARGRQWCARKWRYLAARCRGGIERAWRWILARPANHPQGDLQVKTVWFNAWTAGDGAALEGLMKSVLNALDRRALRKAAREERLMGRVRSMVTIGAQLAGFGGIADRLWTVLKMDPEARNQMRSLVRDAVTAWSAGGPSQPGVNQLLVVFVDDLDRCTPANVFQVFEAMKLYLNVPKIMFVIGFDPIVVANAIKTKEEYSDQLHRDQHIEKVIQVRYQIPPVETARAKDLVNQCIDDSRIGTALSETARKTIIKRNGHNPRRIKRFINSFVVMHRLGDWDDVDDDTLVRVLILSFYFPDFFQLFNGEEDPLHAFLSYIEARDALRSDHEIETGALAKIAELAADFDIDGLAVEETRESKDRALERLDAALPVAMSDRAEDREFVTLVRTLGDRQNEDVQRLLRLIPATAGSDAEPATVDAGDPAPKASIAGLTVAWLTDDRPGATGAMAELEESVGELRLVRDLDDARALLAESRPDALILDVTRDGDTDVGLRDLEEIRREGLFDGPTLLFTARVTRPRRAAARELNASITAAWSDVYVFLGQIPAETRQR